MVERFSSPQQLKTAQILSTLQQGFHGLPNGLADNPLFQEKTVTRAVEIASSIDIEEQGALKRLYKNELDVLEIPSTNPETGVTNIFESLFEGLFDGGVRKNRSCKVMYEGKEVLFKEKGTPILTRSAFITRVLEEHRRQNEFQRADVEEDPSEYHVSIGMIDLHNLRGADFELDGQQDKPADVLINKAVRAIRTAFEKQGYTNKKALNQAGKSWELGRYGGDEFVIGLFGKFSEEERKALYEEIQKQLATDENMSYYQYTEATGSLVVKKEHILLKEVNDKHEVVDVIQFPDDKRPFLTERRLMFREYLERGLLLTNDEFSKIIKKYSPSGVFNFALYRRDYPEESSQYPSEIKTMDQRIAYIQQRHPELAFYFDLARIYDQKNNNSQARRQILLETVENSLFDRLIGEAIYSRDQFQKFLNEKEFGSVHTIDLKFIKEINEKMTYADADMAIKSVWKMIHDSLGPQDREKIMIGRFGGTFVIGVRKGMQIDPSTERALRKINGLTFKSDEEDYSVPLSVTSQQIDTSSDSKLEDGKYQFKNLLKKNEEHFYKTLLLDILKEDLQDPTFIRHMKDVEISSIPTDRPLNKRDLYAMFLKGKRKIERLPKLLSIYNRVPTFYNLDDSLDINLLAKDLTVYINREDSGIKRKKGEKNTFPLQLLIQKFMRLNSLQA